MALLLHCAVPQREDHSVAGDTGLGIYPELPHLQGLQWAPAAWPTPAGQKPKPKPYALCDSHTCEGRCRWPQHGQPMQT